MNTETNETENILTSVNPVTHKVSQDWDFEMLDPEFEFFFVVNNVIWSVFI